jgi:hypothetical protein
VVFTTSKLFLNNVNHRSLLSLFQGFFRISYSVLYFVDEHLAQKPLDSIVTSKVKALALWAVAGNFALLGLVLIENFLADVKLPFFIQLFLCLLLLHPAR